MDKMSMESVESHSKKCRKNFELFPSVVTEKRGRWEIKKNCKF